MGRRSLLTEEERRRLFGVPTTRDALAKLYTFDAAVGDKIPSSLSSVGSGLPVG